MRVHEVLCTENLLRLRDSHVHADRVALGRQHHTLRAAELLDKPRAHGVDGSFGRAERLRDRGGGPVLAVVGRGGVRNIQEINFEVVEGNLQRNRGVELRTATEGSTRWNI